MFNFAKKQQNSLIPDQYSRVINDIVAVLSFIKSKISFLVANPTVFLALLSNFACGSLLFKNLKTLGHFIGSISSIFYYYCLNFSKLSSIPLKIVV